MASPFETKYGHYVMFMEQVTTAEFQLGPDHFPGVVVVRSDGWVCQDFIGHYPKTGKPKPNSILAFPDITLAREYLRAIGGADYDFTPKQLTWNEWLQLAAKSERDGLTYFSAVLQVNPTVSKAAMGFKHIVEVARSMGGTTTDGPHQGKSI